jgi:hypothetical protein
MPSHTWITVPLVVALELLGMNTFADANGSAREAEAWHFVEEFNAAFATNNPDAYFKCVDENITVITPANPYRVEGIRNDREEFEYSLRQNVSRANLWQAMQPKVQVYGDTAVVSFFVRGSLGPTEQPKIIYWKVTDIIVKRGETWKVVHIRVSVTQ